MNKNDKEIAIEALTKLYWGSKSKLGKEIINNVRREFLKEVYQELSVEKLRA